MSTLTGQSTCASEEGARLRQALAVLLILARMKYDDTDPVASEAFKQAEELLK